MASAFIAAGCSSMLPKLTAPRLSVVAIRLGSSGDLRQQQVELSLHAVNPNDRPIAVRSIECQLDVENKSFAKGATEASFTLPARGEIDFNLNVIADLNTVWAALAGGLVHRAVAYRLYGQVHLKDGLLRTIPFDEQGRVKL
jgi:LEA14-like dessication related protein